MTNENLDTVDLQGYSGLDPQVLSPGLREHVVAAVAAAEALSSGTKFAFTEAPQEQLWDFPPGVTSVFEFTRGAFSAAYLIVDGAQYIGSFTSPIAGNTSVTRMNIAHRLGFSIEAERLQARPKGLTAERRLLEEGDVIYFGVKRSRTATARRGRPSAGSATI